MRIAMLIAVACVGRTISVAEPGTSADAKLRVLVVTDGHAFEREPFFAMFDSFDDVEWREVQHPQANDMYAPDRRSGYDVIVLYDMNQKITDEQKAQFVETLKRGKPLVVLHHAIASYQEWPEYARIVGGKYMLAEGEIDGQKWSKSTYKHGVDLEVHIADPKHPITRRRKDFEIHDEAYRGYWVSPDAHALLTVDHPESGKIIGWTNAYGKTRVVCLQGGHDHHAYENANYRTLVHRSILWASRRLRK